MSLFTCIELLDELSAYFPNQTFNVDFSSIKAKIERADLKNEPKLLQKVIDDILTSHPKLKHLSFFSPSLWLPLDAFIFNQTMYAILTELKSCVNLGQKLLSLNIYSFQLPSIEAPNFSSNLFKRLYQNLKTDLKGIRNNADTKYCYEKWQNFSKKTIEHECNFASKSLSWRNAYQVKRYMRLRHGIENQLALAYLHHKSIIKSANYQNDWRQGSSAQTGYGIVSALALEKFSPSKIKKASYGMSQESHQFEENRSDINKDQQKIKHNRISLLLISTTAMRSNAVLTLAKQHANEHLNIKLKSRGTNERYSYLQYSLKEDEPSIILCDPRHGIFQFNHEKDFLFFYEMLYAKEQMQTGICWDRYQVSSMRNKPEDAVLFTWMGKFRSLFTGIKYGGNIMGRVKNFFLFNITLTLFLFTAYLLVSVLAIVSPFLSMLLLNALAQNIGSPYVTVAFILGSAGIFAIADVLYASFLMVSDLFKSFVGLGAEYENILHEPFKLSEGLANEVDEKASSHNKSVLHLVTALGVTKEKVSEVLPEIINNRGADFKSSAPPLSPELTPTQLVTGQ